MKKIATIIVTFNGEKWIDKCLNSVVNSAYPSDIFVVDNCSTDGTLSLVKNYDIDLKVLEFNSGFGHANNVALKALMTSDYDYFFLINQDLYVEIDVLGKLVNFAEKHPQSGIIAPIQFDGKGENIDANFQQYLHRSREKDNFYDTNFCNAAAWLLSKKCLEKVGFFSSYLPHYGEDRNFCERAKFHYFDISIVKNTKVLHDRVQKMSTEKAINLAKIKLLTIFLNPQNSKLKSKFSGLVNVFGIAKYLFKKHGSSTSVFPLLKEYLSLLRKQSKLEIEKNTFK